MKDSLKSGLTFEFKFQVPENKTVSAPVSGSAGIAGDAKVLATGFLVGLRRMDLHSGDQSAHRLAQRAIRRRWNQHEPLGSHAAGLTVTVKVTLEEVDGRKLNFSFTAEDGIDTICEGEHGRYVIDAAKFNAKVDSKASKTG